MSMGLNFDALRALHECANDRLHIHSPTIQHSVILHQHQEKWVHEISESALLILDVCSSTKDVILLLKHHLQDLQSTFRRTSCVGGETGLFETKLAAYHVYRKKLKKEMVKKWVQSLEGMKKKKKMMMMKKRGMESVVERNLVAVGNVLGEVREATVSIVESLQSLLSIPRTKYYYSTTGWVGLKVMGMMITSATTTTTTSNAETHGYDERSYDAKTFGAVEMAIDDIGFQLECIFRRLIQTRVSLLNILSPAT